MDIEKLTQSTLISRERIFKLLNYLVKSVAILLILALMVVIANSIVIWSADTLPTEESLVENQSEIIEVYDYPSSPNSDRSIVFSKDVKVVSNSMYKADSTFINPVNKNLNETYIRKYDADEQIIVTKYPMEKNVEPGKKVVLWESVTYLSEDNEDTYKLERRSVFKADEHGKLVHVSGNGTTCSDYRIDERIYQVEFEDTFRDVVNLYFPKKWGGNEENQTLRVTGKEYYEVNPPEHVEGYFLSNHEGMFRQSENGSEYIEMNQSIRMVPDNPILTLTPLALKMNIEHKYNRKVGSDISGDLDVEEPEWVDEANNCFKIS